MLGPERIPGIGAVVVGRRQALRADFWRLRSASSISAIGDGLRAAALPLLAAEPTRDPQTVALEGVAAGLPWLLLAVAFRLGCGETLFDSAAQAALPTVVPAESLERANGRFYAGNIVGGAFAGAPLGGALFALAAAVPFGLDAGSFLVAALLALRLRADLAVRVTAQPAPRLRAQIAEGLHWLWRHRELRAICSDGAIAFALLAVVGATAMLWNVLSAAFRQAVVPGRLMGRVNSVYRGATWGVVPLGAALGGFTADHLGLRAPLLLSAGVLIMASAAALPRLRNARLAAARAAGG